MHICDICNREFEKGLSLAGHRGHCLHKQKYGRAPDRFGESRKWNKGLTAETDERVARNGAAAGAALKSSGNSAVIRWNRENPPGSPARVASARRTSSTRKRRIATGQLVWKHGSGLSKGSYIVYRGKTMFMRSSYELRFALWFAHLDLDILYEDVRVPDSGSTRISDFRLGAVIYEVKGYDPKEREAAAAFELAGYAYKLVRGPFIKKLSRRLTRLGYPVKALLNAVWKARARGEYLTINLDRLKLWRNRQTRTV